MPFKTTASLLTAAVLLCAGPACADVIDFDGLLPGTILSNQIAGLRFTPNAFSGPGSSSSGAPWASNTDLTIVDSASDDAGGLGGPELVSGMLLRSLGGWLGENGDASFRVSFATPVTQFSATFASVAEPGDTTLWAYDGDTLLGTVSGRDTGQIVLAVSGASITSVVVRPGSYDDWVGVDNISFTTATVPEAGTWALMGVGLGLLALKRRRRA